MNEQTPRTPPSTVTLETERMVREEILLRPARRAAIFCAIVCVSLLGYAKAASAATFTSPTPISIPGFAVANPYPAAIDVTGVTGEVTDVDVRLNGLQHGTLDDVAVALQAPDGRAMMLMNGSGTFAAGPVDLTIDDEAAQPLPATATPTTGRYRPTSEYTGDTFPAPGPGSAYCMPEPHGSCKLSGFDGINPVGQWRLWVQDNLGTSSGQMAGGWTLELATSGPADPTAPETTVSSGPEGQTTARAATFVFSASEPARFECRLDGGAFGGCSSPASYADLGLGSHAFEVRAIDPAGNVDPTPARREFTVVADEEQPGADTKPPQVEVTGVTTKRKRRRATIAFRGSDDRTGPASLRFECSVDGGPAAACESPLALRRLRPGRHVVAIRATDAAGNRGAPAEAKFKLKRKRR